ncbi:MAG: hypothetical protein QCH31_07105 [Methanolobus sp.]|nr:hypothetical protein [Methanolobus sp.]
MPKTKKPNSEASQLRRKILKSIENGETKSRALIREEIGIPAEDGKTHTIFDEMEKHNIVIQNKVLPWAGPGPNPINVKITEIGKGYLRCMIDYGLGL